MRLIDADALLARIMMDAPDFLDGGSSITKAFIMAMISTKSAAPTVKDAILVVRCKDCKVKPICPLTIGKPDNWYCADGRRKERKDESNEKCPRDPERSEKV